VGEDHLIAHVLSSTFLQGGPEDGFTRIDLGPVSEVKELVDRWRAALGAPLSRGIGLSEGEYDPEQKAGDALRSRLLDPLLATLGDEVRRLYVCPDDLVFLVPLDALPWRDQRVGDHWTITNEVSFARLQAADHSRRVESEFDEPGLLALGGVDYDASGKREDSRTQRSGARSTIPARFSRLLQTRIEAESVALLYEELAGGEAVVLTKEAATKQAFFEHSTGKRVLHLATHGWFAPESIRSQLDEEPLERGWALMSLRERATGMAPMLLCGLALAGANRGRNSLGGTPGLLSAEELCSVDLSVCELAVLSACETNVGIHRAGQGIQSLQAALHAAGARSSITSLCKVDDGATRRLMEAFYTCLWGEGMPTAAALWTAKETLREEGAPVRDWAGWVLTGKTD